MPTISDKRLATLYTSFETQKRSNPNLKLGTEQALQILSEIGDRSGWSAGKVLAELKKPGMTQDQQVALAQKGLSSGEKKDLATIIDQGTVPLEAGAKAFLEKVLGRTTPPPGPGPGAGDISVNGLSIKADQANGLTGTTKAGATIEAINLSVAPTGRYHTDDTFVIGKADAQGNFSGAKLSGDMAMHEGDMIRMRARYADGTTSDWINVKANTAETSDTRNAAVAVFRIGLTAQNGMIAVSNINEGRQISEPGAKLQFTNGRTGEKTVVTLDADGTFPKDLKIKGQAGDKFSVAASDGVNNTNFATSVGSVQVPGGAPAGGDIIKDPALHKDELNADGTPKFGKKTFTGPLIDGAIEPGDVQQGQLGDCYFPSAIAALAKADPEVLKNAIKANGDGTYTVTFKERDWMSGKVKDVPVKVDGDLYVRSWGGPLYGHSANSGEPAKMELWFPLLEKAYATWKGSYNDIGNGGSSADVFEAFTGAEGRSINAAGNADTVWNTITKAIDNHKPVSAGTHDDNGPVNYANTGVYGDHSYSVLGYEKSGTERYVILRNPWGESEPAGNGANDGVFKLKLAEFQKLYDNVMFTN